MNSLSVSACVSQEVLVETGLRRVCVEIVVGTYFELEVSQVVGG